MGRPPCCDKVGIKKGPWTPEEDIILVAYIQEHGPGNWRSVPTNTGLMRCNKSCRLRWTNYLRPGIKRGNFTLHEEEMIIHLQSLLGNKWAAIASYLPQRTDNDIKNYWNTHLKKKINKFQTEINHSYATSSETSSTCHEPKSNLCMSMETMKPNTATATILHSPLALPSFLHGPASTYASSTENISRLLEGWIRSSPKINHDEVDSLPASFQNINGPRLMSADGDAGRRPEGGSQAPLSLLENWLLDEATGQVAVDGLMEISMDCCSNPMF